MASLYQSSLMASLLLCSLHGALSAGPRIPPAGARSRALARVRYSLPHVVGGPLAGRPVIESGRRRRPRWYVEVRAVSDPRPSYERPSRLEHLLNRAIGALVRVG